jgi:hypothetical protein
MEEPGRTLRALAETVVPGMPDDPTMGAAEIEAERFISHYLDLLLPGLADGVVPLLDGLAAEERPETTFADLEPGLRARVLERLATHEVADLRELGDALLVLSVAAVYGEWSGQDADGELIREPLGWDLTGWPGPVDGVRSLMRGGE